MLLGQHHLVSEIFCRHPVVSLPPHQGVDLGGYYKDNQYNYNFPIDSTYNGATSPDRYPAYLVMQSFQTYDGNVRLTFRPVQKITLVSRYEYQWSTINTTPDAISGLGDSRHRQ